MRAVVFHEHGGPEVLVAEDRPRPEPRADQVLVEVRACALNHLDVFVLRGIPGLTFELPPVPSIGESWRRCIDTSLPSPDDVQPWGLGSPVAGTHYVVQSRSIDYAQRVAAEYVERAKKALYVFPASDARDALMYLPDYVISRDR